MTKKVTDTTPQTVKAVPTSAFPTDITISANNIYFGSQFNTNQPSTVPKANQEDINLGVAVKGDSFNIAFEKINNNFSTLFDLSNDNSSVPIKPKLITIPANSKSKGDSFRVAFEKINNNFATLFSFGTTDTQLLESYNATSLPELQEYINLGKVANDGLGDPVMLAFQKTNNNFSTLFAFTPVKQNELQLTSDTPTTTSGNITINATNLYSNYPTELQSTTAATGYMVQAGPFGSQEYINIGATPNDGQGDPLRTAFSKINNNFSNLFFTTVSTCTAYTSGLTPGQVICEYPANTFTQGSFQIRSSDPGTPDSQDITISAQITNNNDAVKFTGYALTFAGNALTRYDMDISGGNIRVLANPIANTYILHFIASQVTFIGEPVPGVEIGLDGYIDSVLGTQDNDILTTEN